MCTKIECPICHYSFNSHSEQGYCVLNEGRCFKCSNYSLSEDSMKRIVLQMASEFKIDSKFY